jgi:hypothetical protein
MPRWKTDSRSDVHNTDDGREEWDRLRRRGGKKEGKKRDRAKRVKGKKEVMERSHGGGQFICNQDIIPIMMKMASEQYWVPNKISTRHSICDIKIGHNSFDSQAHRQSSTADAFRGLLSRVAWSMPVFVPDDL